MCMCVWRKVSKVSEISAKCSRLFRCHISRFLLVVTAEVMRDKEMVKKKRRPSTAQPISIAADAIADDWSRG